MEFVPLENVRLASLLGRAFAIVVMTSVIAMIPAEANCSLDWFGSAQGQVRLALESTLISLAFIQLILEFAQLFGHKRSHKPFLKLYYYLFGFGGVRSECIS